MSDELVRSHQVVEDPAHDRLRAALRSLPARVPPVGLTTSLRVIASRERQKFLERRTPGLAFQAWYDRLAVNMGETLRSMVLPIAGGVFTTVLLFSMWLVPTYPLHAKSDFDVPTMLTTSASVHEARLGVSGGDALLDVTVDETGSVLGYDLVTGGDALQDPESLRRLKSQLPLLRFTPATEFGRPIPSKVRLRLSEIDPSVNSDYVVLVKD